MVFEFLVAAIVFFSIMFYIINFVSASFTDSSSTAYTDSLNSKAMQISELLMHTEGTWTPTLTSLGLEHEWPLIANNKINSLNQECTANPTLVKQLLGLTEARYDREYNYNITMKTVSGASLLNCGSKRTQMASGHSKRIGVLYFPSTGTTGDEVVLDVFVW